jgi:tRNA-dihydrouridine synthase A
VELEIPLALIGGLPTCGNLYKCGDKTPQPHYLSAFPIQSEKPDYHRPECFRPLFQSTLSVAPMLDYTDRHFRAFLRLLTRHTLLYTEMVVAQALEHAGPERFLKHSAAEFPTALQLGGSDPKSLAKCAKLGEEWGYQEINLNCGCPSDRVQSGQFGACLMRSKNLVAECVDAMQGAVGIPVSVKTRIGVDLSDSWEFFLDFVETVAKAGCTHWTIHARKAWLHGLSPKENRTRPPLHYDFVWRLKALHPEWNIALNGGVADLETAQTLLRGEFEGTAPSAARLPLDGVMIGRAAHDNPWLFARADSVIFGEPDAFASAKEALEAYFPYIEGQLAQGVPLHHITTHLMGLFGGVRGANAFRRFLSENAGKKGAGIKTLQTALSLLASFCRCP